MPTVPRLTERADRLVELVIRDKPDVRAYRFGAANTLDTAYAGTTAMFTVARGSTFRSPTIRRKRWGLTQYENRGRTRVHYDPENYWTAGGTLPHDADVSFLRIEEQSEAGPFRPAGPILIIPPPVFFVGTRPNLTVAGTAPNVVASATGLPPADALHFVLPRFADSTTVVNNGAASIFMSFNPGLPEIEVLPGQSTLLPDAAVSEVFIRGDGAAVPFSIFFAVVNAEMA